MPAVAVATRGMNVYRKGTDPGTRNFANVQNFCLFVVYKEVLVQQLSPFGPGSAGPVWAGAGCSLKQSQTRPPAASAQRLETSLKHLMLISHINITL